MPAYWIAHVTITDPERYRGYQEVAPAAFARHGARFLARGGASEVLEGEAHQRHVLIEFPDYATALACYRSDEYQEARARRDGACQATVVIVDGLG
ncbi:DUF1330 domain-containing protein [Limimaricola sp. AA108-03]|uniref:DUF1330 domain-containing protein n=1 Tax=Limimaricola sp. AA108-03 TaxID=3425945 RepID=UPI003D785262